jgi:FtsZ-binding cell division protein ZapB
VDQNLELEVLRAQKEVTSVNLLAERESLQTELQSVKTSLNALESSNDQLKNIIKNKKARVD